MSQKKGRKWVGWIAYISMGMLMYFMLRYAIYWRFLGEVVEFSKYLLQLLVREELKDPTFTVVEFEVFFTFLVWCYLTYTTGTIVRFWVLRALREKVSLERAYRIFPQIKLPGPDLSDIELRILLTVSVISGMIQQKYEHDAGPAENLHHVTEVIKLFITNNLFITNDMDSSISLTPVLVFFLKTPGVANPDIKIYDLDGGEITSTNLKNKLRLIHDINFTKVIKLTGAKDEYKNGIFAQTMFDDEDYKVFLGVLSAGEEFDFGSTYQKIIFTDMAALLGFTLTCFKDGIGANYLQQKTSLKQDGRGD